MAKKVNGSFNLYTDGMEGGKKKKKNMQIILEIQKKTTKNTKLR